MTYALKVWVAALAAVLAAAGHHPTTAGRHTAAAPTVPTVSSAPHLVHVAGIMPLGDSITAGTASSDGTGYRGPLDQLLASTPHLWLGTQGTAPLRHEGHPGWTIDQLAAIAHDTVAARRPSVVLLDAGTNDDGQNRTAQQMLDDMSALLDIVLDAGAARVVVAQITLTPLNSAWQQQQETDFDNALPALAASKRDVRVVDMRGVHISADQVHPDDTGYADMAGRWMNAMGGWL